MGRGRYRASWAAAFGLLVSVGVGCGRIGFDSGVGDDAAGLGSSGCGLRDLAVGGASSCAVAADGALSCWGELTGSAVPAPVPLPAPATRVVLAHSSACVLLETLQIACFGRNESGQLGRGTSMADPGGVVSGGRTYVDLAAARQSMCAVTVSGAVECWGSDDDGVLGNGDARTGPQLVPEPVELASPVVFRAIDAGGRAMCADATDGRRFCWGGIPIEGTTGSSVPVEVPEARPLALGRGAACVLTGGDVQCSGRAADGVLGDGLDDDVVRPGGPVGLAGVVAVEGASRQFCAVEGDGDVWCWGANRSGELGTGDLGRRSTPARVAIPPVRRVATGFAHACAETTDGVYCWGGNRAGELGRGTTSLSLAGVPILGIPAPVAVVTGGRGGFGCARTATGDVWCWGQGASGVTGDPARGWSSAPRRIALPFAAVELGVGGGFGCARSDTAVVCWGSPAFDRLGSVRPGPEPTPIMVPGLGATVSQLRVGGEGACVVTDGEARCWGISMSPTRDVAAVVGLPPVKAITPPTPASGHMCALTPAGEAWCWGSNTDGALGRGAAVGDPLVPAPVLGGGSYDAIDVTSYYQAKTCAIPTGAGAALDCWGAYDQGRVDVPTLRALTAVPVALVTGGQAICALHAAGTRDCKGAASEGQYGDGMSSNALTFAPAAAPAATAVGLGATSACFIEAGQIRCVGDGRHGALGVVPGATPARVPLACR